ncbi:hypothetical protein [Bacillus sp. AFS017274]|uniref:GntT/GntP/DsdX family permease n=1 Tax=Bacillaceae TaxID=186817 RepID=UPI000BF5305F|nr:hypothetical protein [Bacillus sp. AFS017274]PEZ82734.1 hypothetical protein CN380_06090 [Bacillus sp. AFS017274]
MKNGIPMLAGPAFGSCIFKRMDVQAPEGLADQFSNIHNREHPGFGITLIAVLMPVLLIGAFSAVFGEDTILNDWIAFMVSVVVSFFTLGYARGFNKVELNQFRAACPAPTASIILIIGAGGAFENELG